MPSESEVEAPPPGPPMPERENIRLDLVIQSLQRQNAEQALTIALKDAQLEEALEKGKRTEAELASLKAHVDQLALQVADRATRRTKPKDEPKEVTHKGRTTSARKAGNNGKAH